MAVVLCASVSFPLFARVFTDDSGRQVEAELMGMRGENVVLGTRGVRGQWPLARLSAADQDYVREWRKTQVPVKKVHVRMLEREGIGERGEFEVKATEKDDPISKLPFVPGTTVKKSYCHFDVTVLNPAAVDTGGLRADYVLYVIMPDGSLRTGAAGQGMAPIAAGKTASLVTEGVTAERTKTTKLKLAVSSSSFSVREKAERSAERFGGAWVKVTAPDGTLVGETKQLSPELSKLDPPWEESGGDNDPIPVLKSLEGLKELLEKLLPPQPDSGKKASLPGPPPGFPPPR